MQALHITDTVTTCDCCGKSDLARTVAMLTDSGELVHYGTTCAARNSGKTSKIIRSEIAAREQAAIGAARKEFNASTEYLRERARFAERNRISPVLLGKAAMEFVRPQCDAADQKCREIAAKHGVTFWQTRS